MPIPALNLKYREDKGGNSANIARKQKKVPAVIYARGMETRSVLVDEREMEALLYRHGESTRLALNLEGEKHLGIIKDIQRSIKRNYLLHIDFQVLNEKEKARFYLPINILNRDEIEKGEKIVQVQLNEVEILTLPRYFPEEITVDVSLLETQDNVTVADLNIFDDENIEIMDEPEAVIATLVYATQEEELETDEDEDEEMMKEPELIGEKKDDEEEE